jgi:hypothetical protein
MAIMLVMLLPWLSLPRVTWYLLFQIWISGHLLSVCFGHMEQDWENIQGNKLREVNHWCIHVVCPLVPCLDEVILIWCKLGTPVLSIHLMSRAHLPCMPPVSDTLFGRLSHLYQHTWMASPAMHWYWSILWLSWYFNPSFSLLISHWNCHA